MEGMYNKFPSMHEVLALGVILSMNMILQTKDGVFTLCAMTSGIRRNWIEALAKNIPTALERDVMCALPQTVPMGMVTECKFASDPPISDEESSIAERRVEGRYKTLDWVESSHMKKKRETLGRQSGVESEFVQEDSVPPAPVPSPEEMVASTVMLTHAEMAQDPYLKSADSSLLMGSRILTSKPADQRTAVVGGVDVYNDLSKEKKKETDRHPLPSPATFSSLCVQTECQWDRELQTLCAELKTTNKRTKKEVREYKLSEARLKAKLSDSQACLRETESTLRKTVATLKKRENALVELQSCLSDISGRLKATEEAQALKDVRLRKHLCLLEESQERERKSLSDSLEHAEKRGKELEERLMQTETVLQTMPTGSMVEQWERKCQELQNQLAESDSELSRLQARLQNEETLYYDMEHNYEQVCEELALVRGTLENCERTCEERFTIQLEQQQENLNRKEQELQESFLQLGDKLGDFGFSYLGKQPVAQGDETEQVISVKKALESKLCDTEERLQEITVHLQPQQQKHGDEVDTCTNGDHWSLQKTNKSLGMDTRDESLNRKHCGIILENSVTNGKDNLATSEMFDFDLQEALQDTSSSPDELLSQRMTNRMLSLEALVIHRMASALDHPTIHFLDGLSDLKSQTKAFREAFDGRHEGPVTKNYLQLFSYYQEMGEEGCSLNECEIRSLCMKAELTYLTYTDYLHNPEVEHGSQAFNVPVYLGSEVKLPHTLEETNSKSGFWLNDVSLPELVPCKKRTQGDKLGYSLEDLDKDRLIVELQTRARSLQALSKQLYPVDENAVSLSEFSPVILRTVLFQAIMAYVTCKLHVAMQRQVHLLQDQREQAACQCCRLEAMLQEQTERHEEKLREDCVVIEVAELARVSAETDALIKGQELQHLEAEFKKKLQEHQQIHEEEMTRLHEYYMQNQSQTVTPTESNNGECSELSVATLKERIHELELHIRSLEDECRRGDANALREAYEQELETLKVTCELGFSSMEQSHQRVIEELQRQHQMEMEQLLEEKDRVLQEETNATIAAIEAMHKAHREELEKTRKVQQNGASTDLNILRAQFNDELESLHRELEVLSKQYSQKCLENARLSRAFETERQDMTSVERENQELHTRIQELNKRLVVELSLMQSCVHKEVEQAELSQSKDVIQLEVAIRVKESEIQCLKQEISSLKEELQAVYRHCKKLLNESSVSGVRCPTSFIKHNADTCRQPGASYDVVKSRSNPDLMKNCTKPNQPIRSKSLREHLSVQERMKLFESGIK